jgi:hypothetical protein
VIPVTLIGSTLPIDILIALWITLSIALSIALYSALSIAASIALFIVPSSVLDLSPYPRAELSSTSTHVLSWGRLVT